MRSKIILPIITVFVLLMSFSLKPSANNQTGEKGMLKVTILYPNDEGKTFDMDYYSKNHMPMLEELFGDAMKKLEIDKGIAGRTPEDKVPYLAIGYLYFDSLEQYGKAFAPHADTIVGDIPNYTNIQPIIQISEVVK